MTNEHLMLLVEDDPVYAERVVHAVESMDLVIAVTILEDGEAALDYLHQREPYSAKSAPRPDLVLLDLRLPRVDGIEVIAGMKESKELRRIPVVAMTTSGDEEDLEKAYDLGVNGFLEKPIRPSDTERMIQGLLRYWLMCNRTPKSI